MLYPTGVALTFDPCKVWLWMHPQSAIPAVTVSCTSISLCSVRADQQRASHATGARAVAVRQLGWLCSAAALPRRAQRAARPCAVLWEWQQAALSRHCSMTNTSVSRRFQVVVLVVLVAVVLCFHGKSMQSEVVGMCSCLSTARVDAHVTDICSICGSAHDPNI
jgi:hypothetical protein